MGFLRRKSKKEDNMHDGDAKLPSSSYVHEPVLSALQEQQPYEQSYGPGTQSVSSEAMRDQYGNRITTMDASNPTRSRDERPLDTIRSFEAFSLGSERPRQDPEVERLGFRPRADFVSMPAFNQNLYDRENVISLGGAAPPPGQQQQQSQVFYPPSAPPEKKKKKKRVFFK